MYTWKTSSMCIIHVFPFEKFVNVLLWRAGSQLGHSWGLQEMDGVTSMGISGSVNGATVPSTAIIVWEYSLT